MGVNNPLIGKDLKASRVMSAYQSLVMAIERGKDYRVNPSADTVFQHGHIVWFVSPLDLQVKELQEAHI